MVFRRLARLPVYLLLLPAALLPARCQTARTSGLYKDAAGKTHNWSVDASNALVWEGKPYLPVGGCFAPRSLRPDASDEDWKQDQSALETLHKHGAQDILIRPALSAAQVPSAAWQRLVDRLEAGGFRYGIAFGSGIPNTLSGIVVRPSTYRTARIEPGTDVIWHVPDATSAFYVIVNETDGVDVYRQGRAEAADGTIAVHTDERLRDGAIGLLYPQKTLKRDRAGGLPDVWDGFDAYRDRLVGSLSGVRFGPGLRFFLDPLLGPFASEGEVEAIVPDSTAFTIEWEAFLARRYATIDDLLAAWTISGQKITEYRRAASLLPLWYGSKGVPYFLDRTNGQRVQLGGSKPRYWSDLRQFEAESLTYYMSAISEVLKREVADVPVVYTHTANHAIFASGFPPSGFDGLGIAAHGHGSALVAAAADAAVSQTMGSGRPMWLVVTETADTPPGSSKRSPGYASEQSMAYDFRWLSGIGARGIFAYAYQAPPGDAPGYDLLAVPDQLAWLQRAGEQTLRKADGGAGRIRMLPYPASAAGLARPGLIGNTGVLWTPSLAPGERVVYGTSYAGYSTVLDGASVVVMWSLQGPRDTRLFAADPTKVKVASPDGQPVVTRADVRRKTLAFRMPDVPVVIRTGDQPVYPIGAIEDALANFRALMRQAGAARLPGVQPLSYSLDRAESLARRGDLSGCYLATERGLSGLVSVAQPYSWREAETADTHSFSEVMADAGASGGGLLVLNSTTPPSSDGYLASLSLGVPADETYAVWISCTPPGPRTSPFSWSIDGGDWHVSTEAEVVGERFLGDQLVWLRVGSTALTRGQHTLRLRVTEAAPGSERFALALDAVLVTRGAFRPNGIIKPSLDVLPPLPTASPVEGSDGGSAPKRRARAPRRR